MFFYGSFRMFVVFCVLQTSRPWQLKVSNWPKHFLQSLTQWLHVFFNYFEQCVTAVVKEDSDGLLEVSFGT